MKNLVSLTYIDSYDNLKIKSAVEQAFSNLNLDSIIKPNMKVLLKVCLPRSMQPDSAETSHPAIVQGVVDVLSDLGVNCIIADSPYNKYTVSHLDSVYFDTGMLEVANSSNCELNHNLKIVNINTPNGVKAKSITLLDIINDVDVIINLGKIKIDEKLGYLGASANMFGLVPGEMKSLILNRMNTIGDFNEYLIDIIDALKDKLIFNILDGVVAIEAGETQRMLSCLAMSENIFSLDASIINILGLNYNNTIIKQASDREFIDIDNPFEIVGDELDSFRLDDFALYDYDLNTQIHKNIRQQKNYFRLNQQRPTIKPNRCKGCSVCSRICPTNAIMMRYDKNGELYADIDYSKCIFCNKCFLGCPYMVVKLKTPLGFKKLHKTINKYNEEEK